ncbi:hypothetical protein Droror1_Dr00007141 [Drosera rotundifolia]
MSNKRARIDADKAIVGVWKREVGDVSTRDFAHRLAASEDLVLRLEILRKLEKHRGCVNTVSFNASGDILVTGSDDRKILLWDWEMGRVKLSFDSGHSNNVFQAKFMPYTDDRTIVTCAADGQVRLAQIPDRGGVETSLLGSHAARAHKLAIEPGSPYSFYTSAEDGLVQHFDLRTKSATKLFTCHSIHHRRYHPYLQLNAITINPRNPNFFAVAGGDAYTRLYDIRKTTWNSSGCDQPADFFCPDHLVGDEQVGITGLTFSDQSELLVSYNDEQIYLFTKEMGLGHSPATSSSSSSSSEALEAGPDCDDSPEMYRSDVNADEKSRPQVYKGHRNQETVKGVSFFGPRCEYVASGSDCGNIFIWRKKDGELLRVMRGDRDVVNCIESHPHTTMMASSGIESDIKIWTPKALEKATLPPNLEEVVKHRSRFFSYDSNDDLSSLDDEYIIYSSEDGDYNENDDNDSDGDEEEEEGSADSGDDDENEGVYEDDDNGDASDLENDGGNNGDDGSIPDAAAVDD